MTLILLDYQVYTTHSNYHGLYSFIQTFSLIFVVFLFFYNYFLSSRIRPASHGGDHRTPDEDEVWRSGTEQIEGHKRGKCLLI